MKTFCSCQRTIAAGVALLFSLCLPAGAAAGFRFAVVSDQRYYTGPGASDTNDYFRGACRALKHFGPGLFMISPGDIDPVEDSQWTIMQVLGPGYHWYPVTGNHELPDAGHEAYSGANMDALRNYDYDPNGPGVPPDLVNSGPAGCPETTFSFDYQNVHFVVLNQYCDDGGDDVTTGDMPDHLYDWLVADLQAAALEHILVFGHEPAFPQPDADNHRLRHLGDSLNQYPANRDRFWDLLRQENVKAYFCGHTHDYSAYHLDGVWQIDSGHARGAGDTGAPSTFLVVDVDGPTITFDVYRDTHNGLYDYTDIFRHEVLAPAPDVEALVATGSVWRYLDDGSDQGTAWAAPDFDDSLWPAGPSPLGYGDGDEATVLGFGPDPGNKYVTSYFRHTFAVADPASFTGFWLRLLRDDGAVVHLNGSRFCSSEMPAGEIFYDTLAGSTAGGVTESALLQFEVDPGLLVPGDNVLAVEIHQAAVTSSDISFDLQLLGFRRPAVIVDAALTCVPASGTLPFQALFSMTLENRYSGTPRRIAARIDIDLADGTAIEGWRSGYTNVAAGGNYFKAWNQDLPALEKLDGVSTFTLRAADVTPAPWNQPPRPPAGETATASTTVTGTMR